MAITQTQIQELVTGIAGVEALTVCKFLEGKENVNEFSIAEHLNMPINDLRNILYKFDEYNLVEHTRKKDRKKGWYIYFWTFRPTEAEKAVAMNYKKRLELLQRQMEREQAHEYYICPDRCVRMTLENAMENNFTCRECGKILEHEDTKKRLMKIEKEIQDIQQLLKEFEESLNARIKKAKEEERKKHEKELKKNKPKPKVKPVVKKQEKKKMPPKKHNYR